MGKNSKENLIRHFCGKDDIKINMIRGEQAHK